MEEKLIELVRQHEILYDKSKSGYRREDLKLQAWAEIAKELKKSVEEIRKRWKTLRDRFNRDRKKLNATTGSAAGSPKRQWKYYTNMMFLLDVPCINKRTISNFTNDSELSAGELYSHFAPNLEIDSDGSLLFDENLENNVSFANEASNTDNSADNSHVSAATTPETNSNPSFRRKPRSRLHSEVLLPNTHEEMSNLIRNASRSFEGASMSSPLQLCFLGLAREVENSGLTFAQRSQIQVKAMTLVHSEIAKAQNDNSKFLVYQL